MEQQQPQNAVEPATVVCIVVFYHIFEKWENIMPNMQIRSVKTKKLWGQGILKLKSHMIAK